MRYLIAMLLLVSAAAGAEAQTNTTTEAPATDASFLEPGDIIRLRIWREETMSGEFRVDNDGTVVFPRLGSMKVTGLDPTVLKNRLIEEYGRYLRSPAIEVTFLRRINVGGAVMRPGVYHIDPTMTVREVLLEAGGATPAGRTDRIELVRDGETIRARLAQDESVLASHIRSGDQLLVPERNWFDRNTSAVVGIGGALLSFAATMIILAVTN